MELPVGRSPAREETLTTWPRPEARRCSTAATVTCQVPKTLTSKIRRQTSGVAASRSWWGMTSVVPALLTRTSSPPWRGDRPVHQGPCLVLDGHVGLDVARVGQLVGQRLAGRHRRRRIDDDSGPERGEAVRGRCPDPRR